MGAGTASRSWPGSVQLRADLTSSPERSPEHEPQRSRRKPLRRTLAPQSIPLPQGCVASARWARVGVVPLSGRDCWPQGQLQQTLLLWNGERERDQRTNRITTMTTAMTRATIAIVRVSMARPYSVSRAVSPDPPSGTPLPLTDGWGVPSGARLSVRTICGRLFRSGTGRSLPDGSECLTRARPQVHRLSKPQGSGGDGENDHSLNRVDKSANCGHPGRPSRRVQARRFQGFRGPASVQTARLKIVVSPVRVRVSPFAIPHSSGIFFFLEEPS